MSRKKKLIGQCPHCHQQFELPQAYVDAVAEASLKAVERAAQKQHKREQVSDGPFVMVTIGPCASTGDPAAPEGR